MSNFQELHSKNLKKLGFTLVELSIVIIIIGLLISGITAGISLNQTVKLNSAITIEQKLQIAIELFKSQYGALPGDFPNASSYWPSTNCIAGDTNANPGLCDGNNDGIIGGVVGTSDATAEGTRALQHLQSAGLISGSSYVGGSPFLLIGVNAVAVPLYNDTGYNIQASTIYLSPKLYNSTGNFIVLSGIYNNGQPGANATTTTEAYYIDNKIDDGLPSSGNILSYSGHPIGGIGPCTATINGQLVYDLTYVPRVCTMGFQIPD